MNRTSSPKHASPSDGTDNRGFLSSLQAGDVAAWAQAGIMASPFLAYLFVYCGMHYVYASFGVSAQLIVVELEDILWIVAAISLPLVLVMAGTATLTSVLEQRWIRLVAAGILVGIQWGCLIDQASLIRLTLRHCQIFDWEQYALIVIQVVSLLIFCMLHVKWCILRQALAFQRGVTLLALLAVFYFGFFAQGVYLAFHHGSYQICDDGKALIVGFDSQGRAIEKQIVSVSDSRICELAPGYYIVDVTGEQLHLENYLYLRVDE